MCIWNEARASRLLLVVMACHSIVILGWQHCPPCNLAESPLQNSPYQRNHTHSLQQSDDTHQKFKDIQYREAVAWSWSQVCTYETNGSNSTHEGLTPRRSSPLRPDITYQPRTRDTDPIATPPSKFQRTHTYREARGPRDLRKVCVFDRNRYQ